MGTEVKELSVEEYGSMLGEIQMQPAWRREADIIADYFDGNQLDSATLAALEELGMAPIIENLMAPTIESVLGFEIKTRQDYLVTPESDARFEDMAKAMNIKLNEAEKRSEADRACTEAFERQAKVGLHFVHVGFEHDPFKFEHACTSVSRNECYFDMKERDPRKWRYFVRRKWYDESVIKAAFPDYDALIGEISLGAYNTANIELMDGGRSTGLAADWQQSRSWTTEEMEWRDSFRNRLCLSEVWYRRMARGKILRDPKTGRVVEFDDDNPVHVQLVESGMVECQEAAFYKTRLSWWIGPHKILDVPNPYKHNEFPYVPFFGRREDLTGIPYALGRAMKPMQDEINARNTKMIWLLTAKRVTMTKGVADVETTRAEAARPDAVHVLDANKLKDGGMFKVETDFQLGQQQYNALIDKRESIKNVAGVFKAFEGNSAASMSGVSNSLMIEQTNQTLSTLFDNFRWGRAKVGELLLSNVIQKMGDREVSVVLKDASGKPSKEVVLNKHMEDERGEYLDNDVQRAMLKVSLSEVPGTSSFRQQESLRFGEIVKSLPENLQVALMEFYLLSTDMPNKAEAVERVRDVLKSMGIGGGDEQSAQQLAQELADAQQQMAAIEEKANELMAQLSDTQKQLDDKTAELENDQLALELKAQIEGEKINLEREKLNYEQRRDALRNELAATTQNMAQKFSATKKEGQAQQ